MNTYINNSFDEKYPELIKMISYKKLNPPEFKVSPTRTGNGIIHRIKLDFHGKGYIKEQYTYNKFGILIHYVIIYDIRTLYLLSRKIKYKKTKEEKKLLEKLTKLLEDQHYVMELCNKEQNLSKRKEMIFQHFEKQKDSYKSIYGLYEKIKNETSGIKI